MELSGIFIFFLLGLVVMVKGGDWFVDAAVWIASVTGMPQVLIGATIVSIATTLPELFVSTLAVLQGYTDVAIGNAVGSFICNIGLILAITLIFRPQNSLRDILSGKGILMAGAVLVLMLMIWDRRLVPFEGILLLGLLLVYVLMSVSEARKLQPLSTGLHETHIKPDKQTIIRNLAKFIGGILMIVLGARWLVDNGIRLGAFFSIPESIIGVTIIALGTSLPELTTAITAIVKGHHGISFGNILGANILNMTMILGASVLLSGKGLVLPSRSLSLFGRLYAYMPQTLLIDLPAALFIMALLFLPALMSLKLKRWHGASLLAAYLLYLGVLITSTG